MLLKQPSLYGDLFHIHMGNLVVLFFPSGRCYCDFCHKTSLCQLLTLGDHQCAVSWQDERLQEWEPCIPRVVLRSTEVFG